MSRNHTGRRLREFCMLNSNYVKRNYLKYLKLARLDICHRHEITHAELEFMLFIYDYEFFTSDHMAEAVGLSGAAYLDRVLYPLQKRGWITKVFDRKNMRDGVTEAQMFFLDDFKTASSKRNRYSLSQRGRLMVQKFYRKLEGLEPINIHNKKKK